MSAGQGIAGACDPPPPAPTAYRNSPNRINVTRGLTGSTQLTSLAQPASLQLPGRHTATDTPTADRHLRWTVDCASHSGRVTITATAFPQPPGLTVSLFWATADLTMARMSGSTDKGNTPPHHHQGGLDSTWHAWAVM